MPVSLYKKQDSWIQRFQRDLPALMLSLNISVSPGKGFLPYLLSCDCLTSFLKVLYACHCLLIKQ